MEIFDLGFSLLLFLVFLVGIVLTFITVRRMITGKISLPSWAKILLTAAMILSILITFISMLPPLHIPIGNPFVDEQTHIVTPVESITNEYP